MSFSTSKTILNGLLGLAIISTFVDKANAICCHQNKISHNWLGVNFVCYDGTEGTPCCGVGRCNFFCCNCGDGCRAEPKRLKRQVGSVSDPIEVIDGFTIMDRNGDAFVDEHEAHSHLAAGACGNYTAKISNFRKVFKQLDRNRDGKLSYAEIDTDTLSH